MEIPWSLFRPNEKGLKCTELINRYRCTHVSRDKPEEAEIRLKNRPSIYIYILGTRRRCAITTVLYIPPPFDITNPLVSAISTFSLACVPMTLDVSCTPLRIFLSLSSPFLFLFTLQWTRRQILISDIHRSHQPLSFHFPLLPLVHLDLYSPPPPLTELTLR